MDINAEIRKLWKKLEAEKKSALDKIESKYGRKLEKMLDDCMLCEKSDCHEYLDRYDAKKNAVVESRNSRGIPVEHTGCGKYYRKTDGAVVEVEDYGQRTVSIDCGYGDCDEIAFCKTLTYYWVCPKCKTMHYISSRVVEQGPVFTRNGSDEEFNAARAFVPLKWVPKVRILSAAQAKKIMSEKGD